MKLNVSSFDSWDYDSTIKDYTTDDDLPESSQTVAKQESSKLIPITVSGQLYFLEPHLFDKLRKLPWTVPSPTTSFFSRLPRSSTPIQYSLRTAPYLFDILVNYVHSGSLPDLTTLRTADLEELEPLVMLLQLPVLQKHLQLQQWGIRMSSVPVHPRQEAPARLWQTPSHMWDGDNHKNDCSNENLESVGINSAEPSLDPSVAPMQQKRTFLPRIRRNSNRSKKDAKLDGAASGQLQEIEGNSIDIAAILPDRRRTHLDKKKSHSERSFLDAAHRKNAEQSRPGLLQKLRLQSERRMSHAEVCASSGFIN